MLKSCIYCRKIHDSQFICAEKEKALKEHRGKKVYKSKYETYSETNVDGFRSTRPWKLKRNEIRDRDRNLCQICIRELYQTIDKLNYNNLSVHHCEPLNENFDKRLDESNLITVCEYHHRLCDNGTIPQEEVKRIIMEQEEKQWK